MKPETKATCDAIEALPDDHTPFRLAWDGSVTGFDSGNLKTLARDYQAVCAERDRYRTALVEIKRYVVGHEEPGYECVQCLIEGLVDAALQGDEGGSDD